MIEKFEGLKLEAYQCPAGIWTIGYGTTKNVKQGMKITKDTASELLKADLQEFEEQIDRLVKVPLSQNQFDSLISLVYNIGTKAFERSILLSRLNRKDYQGVAYEFSRWNRANGRVLAGLTSRRIAERDLWTSS